jgi:hypothetical protein
LNYEELQLVAREGRIVAAVPLAPYARRSALRPSGRGRRNATLVAAWCD